MNKTYTLAVACSILLAALWFGPITSAFAAQGAPAAATATSGSDYKIGVVDMNNVLKEYKKLKTQAAALEAEKDKLQKELNAKTDAMDKKMEDIKNAPEADRERRGEEIRAELRNLRADMQLMQGELDDKVAKLRVQTRQDIIGAIKQIGADENYHLILEGDGGGPSTVIYFAEPINITPKVIEKLNGTAPATAAAPVKK